MLRLRTSVKALARSLPPMTTAAAPIAAKVLTSWARLIDIWSSPPDACSLCSACRFRCCCNPFVPFPGAAPVLPSSAPLLVGPLSPARSPSCSCEGSVAGFVAEHVVTQRDDSGCGRASLDATLRRHDEDAGPSGPPRGEARQLLQPWPLKDVARKDVRTCRCCFAARGRFTTRWNESTKTNPAINMVVRP